jgi:hypothetical protein
MLAASKMVEHFVKPATRARCDAAPLSRAASPLRLGRGAICALIALVFAFPDGAAAQALWRGLELGASVKTVHEAFPAATRPLSVATLADGETDDLVTNDFFLDDRFLQVRFFFREGGLTAVMFSPATPDGQPAANRGAAERLATQLTARYGQPFDCGDKSYAGVELFECKWLAKPLVVRLWYEDVLGEAPSLRVVIRKADDAAYDF